MRACACQRGHRSDGVDARGLIQQHRAIVQKKHLNAENASGIASATLPTKHIQKELNRIKPSAGAKVPKLLIASVAIFCASSCSFWVTSSSIPLHKVFRPGSDAMNPTLDFYAKVLTPHVQLTTAIAKCHQLAVSSK